MTRSPVVELGFQAIASSDTSIELVGCAADGATVPDGVDVVVVDADDGDVEVGISGIAGDVPVLVFASSTDGERLRQALDHGAHGFLYRDADPGMIAMCLVALADGHSFLDPRATQMMMDWARRGSTGNDSELSDRETEILCLVAKGEPNKRIAKTLGMTENTVKTYIRRVFRKLDCSSRSAAAAEAARRGLI